MKRDVSLLGAGPQQLHGPANDCSDIAGPGFAPRFATGGRGVAGFFVDRAEE